MNIHYSLSVGRGLERRCSRTRVHGLHTVLSATASLYQSRFTTGAAVFLNLACLPVGFTAHVTEQSVAGCRHVSSVFNVVDGVALMCFYVKMCYRIAPWLL